MPKLKEDSQIDDEEKNERIKRLIKLSLIGDNYLNVIDLQMIHL